ncbi:MAG: hypothetical protein HKM28_03715 [Flavobacteriaceae bacterium]|nr:hypothetical protein [Flavobacteriaceae bacterium]
MKSYFLLIIACYITVACDQEPINYIEVDSSNAIAVNSELYQQFQDIATDNKIECINFIYNFTLYVFDENDEFVESIELNNDEEFSELLHTLSDDFSISISYPIRSELDNGELFEVTNNQELKNAIDTCYALEVLGECEDVIVQDEICFWTVAETVNYDHPFGGTQFNVNEDGTVALFYNTEVYFGTWIVYYIENELHLNIFIAEPSDISEFWNQDWKVIQYTEQQLIISNGSENIELFSNCDLPCNNVLVTCEDISGTGIGTFDLSSHIYCLMPSSSTIQSLQFSFYENLSDAENETNAVFSSAYINTMNPQSLYARIEELSSGNLVAIMPFEILAETCEED